MIHKIFLLQNHQYLIFCNFVYTCLIKVIILIIFVHKSRSASNLQKTRSFSIIYKYSGCGNILTVQTNGDKSWKVEYQLNTCDVNAVMVSDIMAFIVITSSTEYHPRYYVGRDGIVTLNITQYVFLFFFL